MRPRGPPRASLIIRNKAQASVPPASLGLFPQRLWGKVLNPRPPTPGPRREGLEGQSQGVPICPRCGQPISYIERQRRGNRFYYFAVHYEGYERTPDGRIHKKVRRCYLGPAEYVEVSKLHADLGLTLKGLIEEGRERDYMEALASTIEARLRDGRLRPEEALELARRLDRLAELARRLREYAAAKSSARATAEAVNVTAPKAAETPPVAQAQTAEAGQDKAEAYRALSSLTGRSPEDIEKELAKLREALKELKASH